MHPAIAFKPVKQKYPVLLKIFFDRPPGVLIPTAFPLPSRPNERPRGKKPDRGHGRWSFASRRFSKFEVQTAGATTACLPAF